MKKCYIRLILFDIFITLILLLNSFMWNILNGYYMSLFLLVLIIISKYVNGLEKDRHRYIKDIIYEILIVNLIGFLIYYLFGLIISFVKVDNYYSLYAFSYFIIPIVLNIILKEFLKYNILIKSEGNKIIIFMDYLLFLLIDLTSIIYITKFNNNYSVFLFCALYLLPSIVNNITSFYICFLYGYKPNIIWMLIINLYRYLVPIVPDVGDYILAIIRLLFPLIILYRVYLFNYRCQDKDIDINYNENRIGFNLFLIFLIIIIVYFTSGKFKYYALAIASGSMNPNIKKGDVVVIDKSVDYSKLSIGMVIAYKYGDNIIVHRIVNIINEDNEYYFYTRGDSNNDIDNITIYEEMIVGTVFIKIPYIGYPTVILNEL